MQSNSRIPKRVAVAAAAAAALMGIGAGWVLGQTSFNDVPESDQRSEDIGYAAAQGWFRGYPDGSFRPDRPISEQQLARVIRRAHPGMTRGDAAVFIRGGIDRLRAAGITPTVGDATATTVAVAASTTTTLPAGEPGGGGPGGPGGPGEPGGVDPNPPVVIETTTTTTTAQPAGRTLVYGKENGWSNQHGVSGPVVWWEFRNWDSASKESTLVTSYGGSLIIGEADEPEPYWFASSKGDNFSIAQARCRVSCTTMESAEMPDSIRNRLEADGYTKPSAATTTTTTTAPDDTTTTTTTAPTTTGPDDTGPDDTTTTTTTAAAPQPGVPAGVGERNVVRYGYETGWTDSGGRSGSIFWAEKAISGYRFPADAHLSNWWSENGSARFTITGRDSNGRSVTRILSTRSNPARFYAFEIQNVTATCNHNCTLESSTSLNEHARSFADQYGYSSAAATTTTTTTTAATPTTLPAGPTLVYGKADGWTNQHGVSGYIVWWEFRNWGSASKESTLVTSYGGSLIIGEADEPEPYWFSTRYVRSDFSIASARCRASCTPIESSTMPDSIRNRLIADGYNEPSG